MSLQDQYNTVVQNAKTMIKDIITSSGEHNNAINIIIEQIAAQIKKLKRCMQQIDSIKQENKRLVADIEQLKKQQQDELKNLKQQDKDAKDQSLKENIQQSIQNINDIIQELSNLEQSLKSNNANQINTLQENVKTITEEIGNLCASASKETISPVQTNVGNQDGKIKLKVSDGDIYVTSHERAALEKYLPAYANLRKEVVLTNLPKLMRMKQTSSANQRKSQTTNRPPWRGGFRYGNDLDRILRNSPMHTLNNSTPSKQMTLKSKSKTKTKSVSIRTRKNKKMKKINKVKKVKNLKKNKKGIKKKKSIKKKKNKKSKKTKKSKKRKQK